MWMSIIGFLGGPVVKGLIEGYKAKLAAGNTSQKIAVDLASSAVAAETAQRQSDTAYRIAALGYWYEPDKLMGYTVAIYFAKLLIWDKVLKLGTTDALTGFAGQTALAIVAFYFGKKTVESVGSIVAMILRGK